MSKELRAIHTHAFDFWLARSTVIVIVGLQLLLVNKLTPGPQWLVPAAEMLLLVPLWSGDAVEPPLPAEP